MAHCEAGLDGLLGLGAELPLEADGIDEVVEADLAVGVAVLVVADLEVVGERVLPHEAVDGRVRPRVLHVEAEAAVPGDDEAEGLVEPAVVAFAVEEGLREFVQAVGQALCVEVILGKREGK